MPARIKRGATKEEIAEALEVATTINASKAIWTRPVARGWVTPRF
jgi:alkylhydroperoxidase/carboxymuconolactone decarboxylase family protein YurZ